MCTANQPLRCDGVTLKRCNANGTGEVAEPCALGCNASEMRCNDVAPSNGLAKFLDQTSGEPDLNLGKSATINTDNGAVTVDDVEVHVKSELLPQPGAPTIRVFMVRSLTTKKVSVVGTNALAIVSQGDIKIEPDNTFEVSAKGDVPGPGSFNNNDCIGKAPFYSNLAYIHGGIGGAGFGSPGGAGGPARISNGSYQEDGGAGGTTTGNESLIPLRGGCEAVRCKNGSCYGGRGGGGIQLVSRTKIRVDGIIASNGSWAGTDGFVYGAFVGSAGSGGGVLLEAPIVDVAGRVVANGASGGVRNGLIETGCGPGEDGRSDAKPAAGGIGCKFVGNQLGSGGSGAALNVEATNGGPAEYPDLSFTPTGGYGGGGFGRIRINAAPDGIRGAGLLSPSPSKGTLGTR